jgi:molecular chaperone GrpE
MNPQDENMTDPVSYPDELGPQDDARATSGEEPMEEAFTAGGGETDPEDSEGVAADAALDGADDEEAWDEVEDEGDGALDAELSTLKSDFEALNDRHLRLAAEFNNYRRRVEQERLDLWARAQADLMARLLDVLDDLQRVAELDLQNATVEGIMEGIDLVERKFARVLADVGVEVIDPAGELFDPEVMEAMMREPAESAEEDDRVGRVLQKGYVLKGQLVRPARVSVRKHG